MRKYTLKELQAMPTLVVGQADNLKIDDPEEGIRVWLSRCTVADGESYDHKVTVEERDLQGLWVEAYTYQAL